MRRRRLTLAPQASTNALSSDDASNAENSPQVCRETAGTRGIGEEGDVEESDEDFLQSIAETCKKNGLVHDVASTDILDNDDDRREWLEEDIVPRNVDLSEHNPEKEIEVAYHEAIMAGFSSDEAREFVREHRLGKSHLLPMTDDPRKNIQMIKNFWSEMGFLLTPFWVNTRKR